MQCAPLVIGFYWFIQYTAVGGFKNQGAFDLINCAIRGIVFLVLFALFSARTYSAIQDGQIDCIDTKKGHL
jgi:hypothetical protein